MIVLDASVVVDVLLDLQPHATAATTRIRQEPEQLAAPHLLDVEVSQVLRRFVKQGKLPAARAMAALEDLAALTIHRYPHAPFMRRVFELRDNVTMYDGIYLVLSKALGATLLTRDRALAAVPGYASVVDVIG